MVDRIAKVLKKLTAKERAVIKDVLNKLDRDKLTGLDIQKLQGHDDIFRIRKGDIRIIYRPTPSGIDLLAIERRSEKTYRDF